MIRNYKPFFNPLENEQGQAVAEYAAMLGLVLAMLYTMRVIGIDAERILSYVARVLR